MLIRKASSIFLSLLYSGTNHNYPCLNGNHIFFGVGVGVYISTMKYSKADFDGYVYLKSSDGLIYLYRVLDDEAIPLKTFV